MLFRSWSSLTIALPLLLAKPPIDLTTLVLPFLFLIAFHFFIVPLEKATKATSITYMPWIAFWAIVSIFKSSASVHSDFIQKCYALPGRHLSEVVWVGFDSEAKTTFSFLSQLTKLGLVSLYCSSMMIGGFVGSYYQNIFQGNKIN